MTNRNFKPNFAILDGLRGIASLYVVINHSRGHLMIGGSELASMVPVNQWAIIDKIWYSLLQLTAIGTEFVILFFVLSGFSIAYSLSNGQNVPNFWFKRLIRLYPPYLLALLFAYLVYTLIQIYEPAINKGSFSVFYDLNTSLKNLIYLNSGAYIPQFWSLIHEVFFYLLIPFAIMRINLYYVFSLIFFIANLFLKIDTETNLFILYLFKYNIYFAAGVFLFNNYQKVRIYLFIKKDFIFYLIMTAIFFILIVLNFLDIQYFNYVLAAVGGLLLIVNFLEKGITNKILMFFGEMSYTLYVTHFASIYLFYLLLVKFDFVSPYGKITIKWVWILGVIFSVAMAYPLYIIVEKQTKNWLQIIRKRH